MEKVLIAVAVMVIGVAVAALIRHRSAGKPAQGTTWTVPAQLHRPDFSSPEAPTLIVVFSSETCDSCRATWGKVSALEADGVAVQNVTYQADRSLHDRYRIDAVPTVLVVDVHGAVTASFVGEPSAHDLDEALVKPT